MSKYTVDLTVTEAEALSETLSLTGNVNLAPEIWGEPVPNFRTVALTEAAVRHLETLPEETDFHVDSDGLIYVDGVASPLTVIHND